MNVRKLIAALVAGLVLLGGVAALGAAVPADEQADDNATQADVPEEAGPSDGLPAPVPDHVSAIHETIGSFLDGDIDNLGDALSDILSDGEDTEESDESADEQESGESDDADDEDGEEAGDESEESSDEDDEAEDQDADEDGEDEPAVPAPGQW